MGDSLVVSARPAEAGRMLCLPSSFYGTYSVPHHSVDFMTAQRIVVAVAAAAGGAVLISRWSQPGISAPLASTQGTNEAFVDMLHCAARLRADVPLLMFARQHVAALIVRHWMYLVWLHLIQQDAAPLNSVQRHRALWWFICQVQAPHDAPSLPDDARNRRALTCVKRGMQIASLLLCDDSLLRRFAAAHRISPDALLTLSQHQLYADNLRHLIDQLDRPDVPQRIVRSNIEPLLLPRHNAATPTVTSGTSVDGPLSAHSADHSPADQLLLLSTTALTAGAAVSRVVDGCEESATAQPFSLSALRGGDSEWLVSAQQHFDESILFDEQKAPQSEVYEDDGAEERMPAAAAAAEREGGAERADRQQSSSDEKGGGGEAFDARQEKHRGSMGGREPFVQPSRSERKRAIDTFASTASTRKRRAVHSSTLRSSDSSASPTGAAPAVRDFVQAGRQLDAGTQSDSSMSVSAVRKLREVIFRHPDVELGCAEDEAEHDLFCSHHRQWRHQALQELSNISRDELDRQVQHCHDQYASTRLTNPAQYYSWLIHRWGHRIQVVASVQMESGAVLQQGLSHHSLELHSHDVGCLFYSHDFLLHRSQGLTHLPALSPSSPISLRSAPESVDPAASSQFTSFVGERGDGEVAPSALSARRYWMLASDHARDAACHGNSAHLLELYRLLSADQASSFDARFGVDERAPLDWLLGLGCMLVLVIQTEGTVVLVPSAEANESAHLVTTGPGTTVVSAAGNLLSPRHVARLIRQHEVDGPPEEQRVEWALDGAAAKSANMVSDATQASQTVLASPLGRLPTQAPTAALIQQAHVFLSNASPDDPRYEVDLHRQSWIPDLYFSSQASKLVSDYLDQHSLPLPVLEQLIEMGCSATTRAMATALISKAVLGASQQSTTPAATSSSGCDWGACRAEFGCPSLLSLPGGCHSVVSSTFQQLQSVCRPPALFVTPDESREPQLAITEIVHEAVAAETVQCNSFRSPPPGAHVAETDCASWTDERRAFRYGWLQRALAEQRTVYLTDISPRTANPPKAAADWKLKADEALASLLGRHTTGGFLLQHCSFSTAGVHSPSYFVFHSNSNSGVAIASPHHNESHRCAAWHLLLRQPKSLAARPTQGGTLRTRAAVAAAAAAAAALTSAADDSVVAAASTTTIATPAAVTAIFNALADKSDIHEGNSVLEDGFTSTAVRGRGSAPPPTAREMYPSSVSRAFGQLTFHSGETVIKGLQLAPSTRLLDVGSAFGRFCLQAALLSGVTVTGVEAIHSTAQHAARFLDELCGEHLDIMASVRGRMRLVEGSIIAQLHELFTHRRVLMYDRCFAEETWKMLAYLFSYLSGVSDLLVVSCNSLDEANPDLVRGERLELSLSKSKQSFAAHVYSVDQRLKRRHLVEVFLSDGRQLAVRAVRAIRQGHHILLVHGEIVYDSTIAQQGEAWRQERLPYLVRQHSEDEKGRRGGQDKRAFMYAWGISRYIRRCSHNTQPANVHITTTLHGSDRQLYVVAARSIASGEELMVDQHSLDGHNSEQ